MKTKLVAIKPMTPVEAALQMDLLGHDFFVFISAETSRTRPSWYRRHDGRARPHRDQPVATGGPRLLAPSGALRGRRPR